APLRSWLPVALVRALLWGGLRPEEPSLTGLTRLYNVMPGLSNNGPRRALNSDLLFRSAPAPRAARGSSPAARPPPLRTRARSAPADRRGAPSGGCRRRRHRA